MAFNAQKIDPLDLQPRKAVGVSLPFSSKSAFTSTYQTKDAIKTNLINYFLTGKNERYLNPSFGNILSTFLFEQLTESMVKQIDSIIKKDLAFYFPRVEALQISTIGIPADNAIQFSLRYKIKDSNIEDELVLNFIQ